MWTPQKLNYHVASMMSVAAGAPHFHTFEESRALLIDVQLALKQVHIAVTAGKDGASPPVTPAEVCPAPYGPVGVQRSCRGAASRHSMCAAPCSVAASVLGCT